MNAKIDRRQTLPLAVHGSVLLALTLSGTAAFAQSSITNITLPDAAWLSVAGLNGSGQVVGSYYTEVSPQRAFLWSNGTSLDLGTLGGYTSVGNALNNFGQVVGHSSLLGDEEYHGFFAIGQTMFDLATLGGAVSSASAVNDSGEVTGYSYVSRTGLDYRAFKVDDAGFLQDLGTLGGSTSSGTAINRLGHVIGDSATVGNSQIHGFLHDGVLMRDLETLGGSSSSAYAVNDLSQVTGESTIAGDDETHAFLHDGTVMRDLGTLGGTYSGGYAINNAGQVIGSSSLPGDTEYHAFIFSNGAMQDLGTLGGNSSTAWAINNRGQVIGASTDSSSVERAFLWQEGTMVALNTLLPANSGWDLTSAYYINDAGQIVGQGYYQGGYSWYLMTVRSQQNQAPVARAGGDQAVECNGGSALVHLDGSASTDPDGDALTCEWLAGGTPVGNAATATVALASGSHTLTLRVTDSHGASAEDTVVVLVGDTTPPVLETPSAQSVPANTEGQAPVPDFCGRLAATDNCTAASALVKVQSPAPGVAVRCGTHTVTLTVVDASGNRATCSTTFSVGDVTSPVVRGPEEITRRALTDCQAAVPDLKPRIRAKDDVTPVDQLVITQMPEAGTMVGLGTHEVHVKVADAAGNFAIHTVRLVVVDKRRPVITSLNATPNVLLPADGRMVPVTLSIETRDHCGAPPVAKIVSVKSSDPDTQRWDNRSPDWRITGDLTLELRAELNSKKSPRIYTIKVSCADASGNVTCRSVHVKVPRNREKSDD